MVSDPTPTPTTEAAAAATAASRRGVLRSGGAPAGGRPLCDPAARSADRPARPCCRWLHFQAGGRHGFRAWGPVVGLLGVASAAGMAAIALPLLAAYLLLVVLPAVSIEAWARWRWSEGRWVAVATLASPSSSWWWSLLSLRR